MVSYSSWYASGSQTVPVLGRLQTFYSVPDYLLASSDAHPGRIPDHHDVYHAANNPRHDLWICRVESHLAMALGHNVMYSLVLPVRGFLILSHISSGTEESTPPQKPSCTCIYVHPQRPSALQTDSLPQRRVPLPVSAAHCAVARPCCSGSSTLYNYGRIAKLPGPSVVCAPRYHLQWAVCPMVLQSRWVSDLYVPIVVCILSYRA